MFNQNSRIELNGNFFLGISCFVFDIRLKFFILSPSLLSWLLMPCSLDRTDESTRPPATACAWAREVRQKALIYLQPERCSLRFFLVPFLLICSSFCSQKLFLVLVYRPSKKFTRLKGTSCETEKLLSKWSIFNRQNSSNRFTTEYFKVSNDLGWRKD